MKRLFNLLQVSVSIALLYQPYNCRPFLGVPNRDRRMRDSCEVCNGMQTYANFLQYQLKGLNDMNKLSTIAHAIASQVFRREAEVVGYMGKPNSLEAARQHCWDLLDAPMPNEERPGEEGLFYTKEEQDWYDAVESGIRKALGEKHMRKAMPLLDKRIQRGFTGGKG